MSSCQCVQCPAKCEPAYVRKRRANRETHTKHWSQWEEPVPCVLVPRRPVHPSPTVLLPRFFESTHRPREIRSGCSCARLASNITYLQYLCALSPLKTQGQCATRRIAVAHDGADAPVATALE